MAGVLMTEPYFQPTRLLGLTQAIALYSRATQLDSFPGTYPPDDTGSSGLAVAKAAKAFDYISGYTHAFGLKHVLGALALAPVIAGVFWYDSFDQPDPDGQCRLTSNAQRLGGHQIELFGVDSERERVWAYNSMGPYWGPLNDGSFYFTWETFDKLLQESGDVTTFQETPQLLSA
jgi:hypothetical protein